jgi:hypothetical protein
VVQLKPQWLVLYDKKKDNFVAVKHPGGLTPEIIKGKKVVIVGCWKYPNDAIDYAKHLASIGRLRL